MITYRNKNGALQIQRKIGNCIIRRIIHNDKFGVDDFFLIKFDNHPIYGNFGLCKRNFDIKEMSSWNIKERKERLGDKWRSDLHYIMSFVVQPDTDDRELGDETIASYAPVAKSSVQKRKANEAVIGDKRFNIDPVNGVIVY